MADGLARRMARGTLAQQGTQVVMLVAALVSTTVLARHLELAEFGVYGLVVSFLAYVSFALGSAEAAAVRAMAAAAEAPLRNRLFTATLAVYGGLGIAAGVLLAGGGALAVALLGVGELRSDAQLGAIAVGVVTALGWPLKAFHALLRAEQRFVVASASEAAGHVLAAATVVVAVVAGAPLWLLIAIGSGIPLFAGLCAAPAALLARRSPPLALTSVGRDDVRDLLAVSAGLLGVGAADVVVTALDRVILAAFRSTSTLGLYEAAIRPNNLIRSVGGAFSVTLLPVISRLSGEEDRGTERALVLRGTRYMLAGVVPPTAALIALAEPVLEAWLGAKYGEAWIACTIFLVWWLVAANASIAETTMVVDRRLRRLATLSWATALINLALSLALTPLLGLEGVALGTTGAYLAVLPFWVAYMLKRFAVPVRELAATAWLPAYSTAALVLGVGLAARAVLPFDSAAEVFGTLVVSVAIGWAFLFAAFLTPDERRLSREVLGR